MATLKSTRTAITPEDMEALRDLQAKLDSSVQDAAQKGNVYMSANQNRTHTETEAH